MSWARDAAAVEGTPSERRAATGERAGPENERSWGCAGVAVGLSACIVRAAISCGDMVAMANDG